MIIHYTTIWGGGVNKVLYGHCKKSEFSQCYLQLTIRKEFYKGTGHLGKMWSPALMFCRRLNDIFDSSFFDLLLLLTSAISIFFFSLSIQRFRSPNASFVGPFFSLLALFLVKLSWEALMILIHAQTTLTCVSSLCLRYYHRAQWLAWFCLWLHR